MKFELLDILTIEYEKRQEITMELSLKITLAALLVSFIIMSFIFLVYGVNPLFAFFSIFSWAYFTPGGLAATITRSIPLLLCGVGLVIAFKALFWNIGAEGQFLMGAVAATWVALFLPGVPDFLMLPTIYIMAFLFGAIWGVIPAILKVKFEANEVITTLMMNYIAIKLVKYLVYGPWKGKYVFNFPYSDTFPESAWEPIIPGTTVHLVALAIAILSAIGLYFFLNKSTLGYEIRVVGENVNAAKYAGIDYFKVILLVMIISGGLAGLAGAGELTGLHHKLQNPEAISPGYGYTAILVAWLARLNPLYAIIAAIFIGSLIVGGKQIQIVLGLPFGVVNVFTGVMLFSLIGLEPLREYTIKLHWNEKYPWGKFLNNLFHSHLETQISEGEYAKEG